MERRLAILNNKHQKLSACLTHQTYEYLIILCHGYTSSKDFKSIKLLARSLSKNNYSTLRFDFSGSGQSEGSPEMSLIQQVADLRSVISAFPKYRKIILVGHSLGALPVCVCSSSSRVSQIVTLNGFFGGKILFAPFRRAYFSLKFFGLFIPSIRREWQFFKNNFQPQLVKKPMLLVTTPHDEILDYHQSVDWANQLNISHQLVKLPLTNHGLSDKSDIDSVVDAIIDWQQLRIK